MKKQLLPNWMALFTLLAIGYWYYQDGRSAGDINQGATGDFVLAVNWQPAFCEGNPNRPECRSQRAGRFDAQNFSLHGLWPQPREKIYCDVPRDIVSIDKAGRWNNLPKLDLDEQLRRELMEKMPGYRSGLHRHEWIKHGTCMSGHTPKSYFAFSLALLDQLNDSAVAKMMNDHLGKELSLRNFRYRFERAFGSGTGNRIIVDCSRDRGRRLIAELKLSLSLDVDRPPDLASALKNGNSVGKSCPAGIVDRVGLQ